MNKKNGCKMINMEFTEYHEYAEKICPNCKELFCYNCCESTNIDQGGKYEPDYMNCPICGYDYYQK